MSRPTYLKFKCTRCTYRVYSIVHRQWTDGWMPSLALLRTLSDKRWALKELIRRGWKEKADSTVWNWVRRLPFKTRCLSVFLVLLSWLKDTSDSRNTPFCLPPFPSRSSKGEKGARKIARFVVVSPGEKTLRDSSVC